MGIGERLKRLEALAGKSAADPKQYLAQLARTAATTFARHGKPVPEVLERVALGRLTDLADDGHTPVWSEPRELAPGIVVQIDLAAPPPRHKWFESEVLPQLLSAVSRWQESGAVPDPGDTPAAEFVRALELARQLDARAAPPSSPTTGERPP
jgi:hypothetical protein